MNSWQRILPRLLLICTMIFWGSAFVGSKVVVGEVPPTVGAFFRFAIGAFFMWVFLLLFNQKNANNKIRKKEFGTIAILGLVGVVMYNLLFFWGLTYAYASDGSSIVPTMSPVFTTIFAVIFLKSRVYKHQLIGFLICLIGATSFFIGMNQYGQMTSSRLLGDLFFFLCACSWGFYTMLGKKVMNRLDPLPVTAYATMFGATVLGVMALPDLIQMDWTQLSKEFWLLQLYLGFFCTALANLFYSHGVNQLGATKASAFMYFVPVNGLCLSFILLKETLTDFQIGGVLLMLIGVWFVNKRSIQVTKSSPSTDIEKPI